MTILVWDFPTRIFHWLLAASFAGAWATAESEWLRDIHVALGYTMAGLIAFRVLWGFVGSRYARFSSFSLRPARVAAYLRSLLTARPEHHVGHNPAGSLAVVAMLALGLATVATGVLNYEGTGAHWLSELHEGAAGTMAALVGVHIAGVLVSSLLHRENLVRAMITGYKRGAPHAGIRHGHALVAAALVAAVAWGWISDYNSAPDASASQASPAASGWSRPAWRLAWHEEDD
ncbi:MAG: cytochrome B [Rhodocyclales bacterium CG_4_9_14_3_um_filter_68_10]|nr:MAG: cytochrome B [Rhodocyclales bacterium CG_4_9_14_3_um_filter_68_10]